jgi:MFS family permease
MNDPGANEAGEAKMSTLNLSQRRGVRIPDSVAFWSFGGILTLFIVVSAAPSPLYQIYAAHWHFSSLTLTVVFALYAIALLASLLITGRLSDHLGRRPVILAAVALEIVAMVWFIAADSVGALIVARVLAGLATGASVGPLSAGLTELADASLSAVAPVVGSLASNVGLAIGGIGAAALVQYAPDPLRLVYWVLLAALVVSFVLVGVTRETGERRPGIRASLKPIVEVPVQARSTFVKAVPAVVGLWALAGLYLSLGPGLLTGIVGSDNLLWGGAVILACWGCATFSGIGTRKASPQAAAVYGCIGLTLGISLTFVGIATSTTATFLLGAAVAGCGLGPTWLGTFRAITALAPASQRAGTVAALYIVAYLAFSIPIVIAGIATTHFGLHGVALVYSGAAAALTALGALTGLPAYRQSRRVHNS